MNSRKIPRSYFKHLDGHIEEVPYFYLPANDFTDVISPSCYSCFNYTNALADFVVGYMGVPKYAVVSMTKHPQYVTVRTLLQKKSIMDWMISDVIIVQGELDKLAKEEAGFKNCVSVPDGDPPKDGLQEVFL